VGLREGARVADGRWKIDDAMRLQTLREYGIFSLGPEKRYDEIATQAADALHAPAAVINFIERDRQWFKARHGVQIAEPPIDQSICVHCLKQGETLVIDDLRADPRTKDLSLVTADPMVRFYAGVPIVVEGQGVGVLAVMDVHPRLQGISASQSEILGAHARRIAGYIYGS